MPFKFEKENFLIRRADDKRVKLTHEQRQEIKENNLGLSNRALALKYKVSRRTVQFIRDPEKLAANLEARKNRGGTMGYYDKEKHREYIRTHRSHKKSLYEAGKLYQ